MKFSYPAKWLTRLVMNPEERKYAYRMVLPDGHRMIFPTMWEAVRCKDAIQKLEVSMIEVESTYDSNDAGLCNSSDGRDNDSDDWWKYK